MKYGLHLIEGDLFNKKFFNALNIFNGFTNTDSCFNLISNAFYGESSNGNWSIKIVDKKVNTEGTINNWKITIFGR